MQSQMDWSLGRPAPVLRWMEEYSQIDLEVDNHHLLMVPHPAQTGWGRGLEGDPQLLLL